MQIRKEIRQAQLGVPHSRIQVELGFILQAASCQILDFAQNPRQNQRGKGTELHLGGVTPHLKNIYTYFLDVGNNWSEEKTYTGRGDTTHKNIHRYFLNVGNNWGEGKKYTGRGNTAHTLLMGETIGVGTAMSETFQTPSRHLLETFQTPYRHHHTDTNEKLHSLLQSERILNKSS